MRLRAVFMENPRIQPLLDGSVGAEGIAFDWELGHPAGLYLRHLRENAFDLFEFSLSGYLVAKDRPAWAHLGWTALPVFLSKAFLPLELCVNTRAGLQSWADLAGKRIGLPDYNMTAAIWLRVMLRELYGIAASDITWVNGRRPDQRHSTLLGFNETVPGVAVRELEPGASLQSLLERGELDAAFGDGQVAPVNETAQVRRLFDAAQAMQVIAEFAQKTGTTPINHTAVLKERVLAEHPQAAQTLYALFEQSKQEAYRRARQASEAYLLFPDLAFARQEQLFGADPYPAGIAANRHMLELLIEQLVSEGQIQRPASIEHLFAPATRST